MKLFVQRYLRRRYGSLRGLLRLILGHLEWRTGRLRQFSPQRARNFSRLVFVCQGNICRSAFAASVALRNEETKLVLPVASLGLSTCSGAPSPPEAQTAAAHCGIDLSAHQACDWTDFEVHPADLFLVMEVRQARELLRRLAGKPHAGVVLLGLCCQPALPHIHDPLTLGAEYFDMCFMRLGQAVLRFQSMLRRCSP